jgi:hypothetical protein
MAAVKSAGTGWAAKEIVERVRTIVRLEIELALLEIKRKFAKIGVGVALGVAAAVVALFGTGFLLASGASGLSHVIPMWAALLVVGFALLLLTALLGWLAVRSLKEGSPPVPAEAIEEARLTAEAVKNGR